MAERPKLRGRLHLVAFVASLGGLIWLVRSASTPRAHVAAWIYGITALLLYLTSASYHVFTRSPAARRVMQRIDHSMIYVLIAGTFTPMCLLVLHGSWRWVALSLMWSGAVAGILIKSIAFDRWGKVGSALYIILGWGALMALPSLIHRPALLAEIIIGGVLYTVGAALFAMGKPKLSPRWFGYHEVWHTFGVAAGVLLFTANLGLVRAG